MDNNVKVKNAFLHGYQSGRQLFGYWGYYCEKYESPFNMEIIKRLISLDMLPAVRAKKIWEIEEMELGWN